MEDYFDYERPLDGYLQQMYDVFGDVWAEQA